MSFSTQIQRQWIQITQYIYMQVHHSCSYMYIHVRYNPTSLIQPAFLLSLAAYSQTFYLHLFFAIISKIWIAYLTISMSDGAPDGTTFVLLFSSSSSPFPQGGTAGPYLPSVAVIGPLLAARLHGKKNPKVTIPIIALHQNVPIILQHGAENGLCWIQVCLITLYSGLPSAVDTGYSSPQQRCWVIKSIPPGMAATPEATRHPTMHICFPLNSDEAFSHFSMVSYRGQQSSMLGILVFGGMSWARVYNPVSIGLYTKNPD